MKKLSNQNQMALLQKISLDNSDFKKGMDECTSSVNATNSEIKNQTKSVAQLAQATHSASAKTTNYKKQFTLLQRQLQTMLINYRALSDEEKQSDFGRNLSRQIDELTEKAANWKDSLGDMQAAIQAASSDTLKFDAMNEGLDLVKSGLESFISLTGFADTESEKFKQTIATLTKIETTFNFVIKVTNTLQKNSALMQQITTIQTKARRIAEEGLTDAIVKQTIKQRIANAVAKANPYVLVASALIAATSAVLAYTGAVSDSNEEEEESNKIKEEQEEKTKKLEERQKSFADEVGKNVGEQITNYKLLQAEWQKMSTKLSKTDFLKKYKTEIDKLPVAINSVADAENAFVKNTDTVIAAILKRAKAEAAYTKVKEIEGEKIALQVQKEADIAAANATFTKRLAAAATVEQAEMEQKSFDITIKSIENKANAAIAQLDKQLQSYMAILKESGSIGDLFTTPKSNTSKTTKTDNNQSELDKKIKAAKEAQEKAEKLLENHITKGGSTEDKTGKQLVEAVKKAKQTVTDLEQIKKDISTIVSGQTRSEQLQSEIEKFQKTINELSNKTEQLTQAEQTQLSNAKKSLIEAQKEAKNLAVALKVALDPLSSKEAATEAIKNVKDLIQEKTTKSNIQDKSGEKPNYTSKKEARFEFLTNQKEQLLKFIDEDNELLKKIKAEINNVEKAETMSLEDKNDAIKAMNAELEKIEKETGDYITKYNETINQLTKLNRSEMKSDIWAGTYDAIKVTTEAVTSFQSAYQSLIDVFNDPDANFAQKFEAISNAVFTTIDTILSLIDTFSSLTQMVKLFSATQKAASVVNTATTQAETQAGMQKVVVNSAEAISGATASGAQMPFPYNIIAIATGVAAVVAALATVASCFADGGIVNSGSKIGDTNLVRVNGGEMILNTAEQTRLFSLLNGKNSYVAEKNTGGNVQFRIKGSDLEGVLNTTKTKHSKL